MPLSDFYGSSKKPPVGFGKKKNKKHEKSESKSTEKMETGPSKSFQKKFGVM